MEDEENKSEDVEPSEFYFESDHLALKGNKDYTTLLKTIVILEAQRVQAIEDLDKLLAIRSKALKDRSNIVRSSNTKWRASRATRASKDCRHSLHRLVTI